MSVLTLRDDVFLSHQRLQYPGHTVLSTAGDPEPVFSRMPYGIVGHILQQQFCVNVVEIRVPDLYQDPRDFTEKYANDVFLAI